MPDAGRDTFTAPEHGEFVEIFPDVYMVTGAMKMAGSPLVFSRNMIVVRQGAALTLINSIRLSDHGLNALQGIGDVKSVIRLAGFHGADDAFYKNNCGADVYAIRGQVYVKGFDLEGKRYFEPDYYVDDGSDLPIEDARIHTLRSANPPEAVLLMLREGGILVCGDALQNWRSADRYFSLPARILMRLMGFIRPCNVGPGWLRAARPSAADLRGLLDLRFEHVLPAHGDAVIGDARACFRPAIERAAVRRKTPG